MIHTLLVLPSMPSFVVLPVVGAFNIDTSSLSLVAAVDDSVAANEGIPSIPTATVNVVDVIVVTVFVATIYLTGTSFGCDVPLKLLFVDDGCGNGGDIDVCVDVSCWGDGGCIDVPFTLLFDVDCIDVSGWGGGAFVHGGRDDLILSAIQ